MRGSYEHFGLLAISGITMRCARLQLEIQLYNRGYLTAAESLGPRRRGRGKEGDLHKHKAIATDIYNNL